MAKRTAESQKTKDDQNSDGEESVENGVRDTPLAPVEGRKIRGLPKRGMGGATPAASPVAQPNFAAPAAPASTSTPFSGFAFGSANAFAPAPSTSFGATSSSASSFQAPSPPSESNDKPAEEPSAASPFSGFTFGKPSGNENPKASSSPFSFGAPSSGFAPPAPASNGAMSSQSDSAEAAAPPKPFAGFSFANSTSASNQKPPEPVSFGSSASAPEPVKEISTPTTSGPVPSLPTPPPEGEVSYYTTIRGLNTATLSFLTSTVEGDSFVDLSDVLPSLAEQYRKHMDTAIGSGWRPEGSKPMQRPSEPSKIANGTARAAPSMPTVGSFSLPKPATTSNPTPGTGFTPTLSSSRTSSPFSFPTFVPTSAKAAPTPTATPKKPSADVSKIVEDVIADKAKDVPEEAPAPKPFTFGVPASSSQEPAKPGSLFSFAPSGPLHPPTPGSESFTPSKNIESPFAASPAKLGKFGPGGSQPQLSFGGASASPSTPGPSKPVGFAFGSSPSGSGGFNIGSGSGPPPATSGTSPSFSFGSKPAAPAASAVFAFGSKAASGAAPAAPSSDFSFGTSKPFSFGTTPSAGASASPKPTFSFGNASSITSSGLNTPEIGSADVSETNSEAALGDDGGSSKNLADTVGAGEEGEETVSERRAKLYQFIDGTYQVKGLGVLRLKRSEGDGKKKRRLLMRSDGGGAILLNMTINEKFDPSVDGFMVKFVGFDLEGKPVMYGMRVKTKEMATEFADELKKEVEAIKSE